MPPLLSPCSTCKAAQGIEWGAGAMKPLAAANDAAGGADFSGGRGADASCGSAESEQSRLQHALMPGSSDSGGASAGDSLPAAPATTAAAARRRQDGGCGGG